MRLSRFPGPLPPHPSWGRDLLTPSCEPTRIDDPYERSADASLRRREKYVVAVILAGVISAALAEAVWSSGLTGDAARGEDALRGLPGLPLARQERCRTAS